MSPAEITPSAALSTVVLAGGRARRMGGQDKGLIQFLGEPLATQICATMALQTDEVMINANRNLGQYRRLGYKIVADSLPDYQGPLAGMYAALLEAKHTWLLTVPCDGPYIAVDYADKMRTAVQNQNVLLAVATDGERLQPVYALIHRSLAKNLDQFLQSGERKIDRWYAQHTFATVDFSEYRAMFTNINTPQQLSELENDK